MIPTLHTDRLILRAPSLQDLPAYTAMWADPRTTAFIGGGVRPPEVSYPKFLQMCGLWALYGYGYWSWIERASGTFIGNGGLANFRRVGIPQLEGFPEAGWAIAPDCWGKGYTSEAVAAIVSWADTALNAAETRCIIEPGNAPSIRVAEKAGFVEIDRVESELGTSIVFARDRRSTARP